MARTKQISLEEAMLDSHRFLHSRLVSKVLRTERILETVKYDPTFPAGQCHQNCRDFAFKNNGFQPKPVWLVLHPKGDPTAMAIYHSIVHNKTTGEFIDVTKRISNHASVYHQPSTIIFDTSPNYLIDWKGIKATECSASEDYAEVITRISDINKKLFAEYEKGEQHDQGWFDDYFKP